MSNERAGNFRGNYASVGVLAKMVGITTGAMAGFLARKNIEASVYLCEVDRERPGYAHSRIKEILKIYGDSPHTRGIVPDVIS